MSMGAKLEAVIIDAWRCQLTVTRTVQLINVMDMDWLAMWLWPRHTVGHKVINNIAGRLLLP